MATLKPATDPWCLWFRDRLATMGLTPTEFAAQLGVSRQTVYNMLRDGGSIPARCRFERMSILLGCQICDIEQARGRSWKTARGIPYGRGRRTSDNGASHASDHGACA